MDGNGDACEGDVTIDMSECLFMSTRNVNFSSHGWAMHSL